MAVQSPRLNRNVIKGTTTAAVHQTDRLTGSDQSGEKPTPIMRRKATTKVLMSSDPTHCPCSRANPTPQQAHRSCIVK